MLRHRLGFTLLLLAVGATVPAQAQKATERYIPVGKSPGISGVYAYLGEIIAADAVTRIVTVRNARGETRTIRIPESAKIWLDRTALQQPNVEGTFADLRVGRTIESKYEDYDRKEAAEWVKVVVTPGGG